jgi:hypothetical protein
MKNQPIIKSYNRIIAEIEQAISEKRNSELQRDDARRQCSKFVNWKGIVPA